MILPEKDRSINKCGSMSIIGWQVFIRSTQHSIDATVLQTMASSEIYFDRNGAANLWYNYSLIFPDSMDVGFASRKIAAIRAYQAMIPEDTTPFHVIPIPPLPYGVSYVSNGNQVGTLELAINPNPADNQLTANIGMPYSSYIELGLYDALGREVQVLSTARLNTGANQLTFDCTHIPARFIFPPPLRCWNRERQYELQSSIKPPNSLLPSRRGGLFIQPHAAGVARRSRSYRCRFQNRSYTRLLAHRTALSGVRRQLVR